MPGNTDLVERSGDLKVELVSFALRPRFAKTLRQEVERRFGERAEMDESEFANFLDWFILQGRLPGGRGVVEHFVADHPELPEEERAMLLGWRDVVEGIFEVKRREGEALVVDNLVDELTYRVRSNMGPAALRPMRPRSFLIARLVPAGDEWLLSGIPSVLPAANRDDAYRLAVEYVAQRPELVARNPEKLAQAWEMQRQERRHFIAFFGSDQVVLPGRELAERMQAYAHYRLYDVRDDEGKSAAEYAEEKYGVVPPPIDFQITAELSDAETVGVIFDETEGLNLFADFGIVDETFADPPLTADREHRQAVLEYLKEKSISPLPFRRLAERDPELASQVFQRVLGKPGFSWERDGETLLRRYKAAYFKQPVLPGLTVLSDPLARAQMSATETGPSRPR